LLLDASATRDPAVSAELVAIVDMNPRALSLIALLAACHYEHGVLPPDSRPGADASCPAGHAGAACVLALYDEAIASCEAAALDRLVRELDARRGDGPLWADGRALFRSTAPLAIAGTFNDWSTTALVTEPVCGSPLVAGTAAVARGHHTYKTVTDATWTLDVENPAFAYDAFAGNPDGKNSVLNTPDSGRGHLVALDRVCSTALGNCRDVTAYLPPGYHAPATAERTYPVLFMHDGRNVWDDHDCCFGHTGWEVNVALDAEIAAGHVAPAIVIAADQTPQRNDEYGLSPVKMAAFIAFQVGELQPRALAKVRGSGRVLVAGSSLGGLVSMELALRHPQIYAGVASLSGAFWPNQANGEALRDHVPVMGKQPLAIYLDHGGQLATNSDGAADSVEVRDLLVGLGWQRADSPACTPGDSTLCYFHDVGAKHDELAWGARTWRFLRFLLPP
jgi:predicted alpha/beta superfamily hydrolase